MTANANGVADAIGESGTRYLTWGPVRDWCGHVHRTLAGAEACMRRDGAGCVLQGGYSDRRLMVLGTDGVATWRDGSPVPALGARIDGTALAKWEASKR